MKLGLRWKVGCGLAFACAVLFVACGALMVHSSRDRTDQSHVVYAFTVAMQENDAATAKWFAAPEQWKRIDTWMARRKGYTCPFSLDSDDSVWQSVGPFEYEPSDPYPHNHIDTGCWPYFLSYTDLFLERRGNEWFVTDVGQLCENMYRQNSVCDPPNLDPSNPPTAVLYADRSILHVGDTVTLTADVNAAPLAGLYEPRYVLTFYDEPNIYPDHQSAVEKHGMKYIANLAGILEFVSIDSAQTTVLYTDNSLTATFRAIKTGTSRVELQPAGQVCKRIAIGADGRSFFDYGLPGCTWDDFGIVSEPVTITVEP